MKRVLYFVFMGLVIFSVGIITGYLAKGFQAKPAATWRVISNAEELDAAIEAFELTPLLIDLRDRADFEAAHIPEFLNISNEGSEPVLDGWIAGHRRDRPVVLICYGGNRSARAFEKLAILGFTHIIDFSPGYAAYASQKGTGFAPETGTCNCPVSSGS